MAASDHLNERLFHGASLRFGLVRPGEKIIPAADLKIQKRLDYAPSTHYVSWSDMNEDTGYVDGDYYPYSYGVAHATPSYEDAQGYAEWNAMGGSYNLRTSRAVVYEVEPSHDMEPDEYDDGAYVSPTGFRVKNIAWIDDDNVPVIKKKGE